MKAISQALVKFQSQLKPVNKDSENPFFKSSYADLSSILQAVMPILSSNGLAISQPMKIHEGFTVLMTRLIHESGESLESEMILPVLADPQKFGSLITYYKRYQLQAMLGISTRDEDDDANTLVPEKVVNRQYQAQKPANAPIAAPNPIAASDAQKNALKRMGIAFQANISKSEASNLIEQANKR